MSDTWAVDVAFAIKLKKFIRYTPSTDSCDYDRAKELHDKFDVETDALKSWAKGMTAPSPMKRRIISDYLDAQKHRA